MAPMRFGLTYGKAFASLAIHAKQTLKAGAFIATTPAHIITATTPPANTPPRWGKPAPPPSLPALPALPPFRGRFALPACPVRR